MQMSPQKKLTTEREVSKTLTRPLTGTVEFDFGNVSHPEFGTAHVKGKFPRLQPQFKRSSLTPVEVASMKASLGTWVETFFETTEHPEIFDGMLETLAHFVAQLYPFPQIDSNEIKIALKVVYWTWILDNIMELAITQLSVDILERTRQQILLLLGDNTRPFVEITGFSASSSLFHSLQDLLHSIGQYRPNYQEKMDPIRYSFERYFDAMLRQAVTPLNSTSPEESFLNYRTTLSYYDIAASMFWILESDDCSLPMRIAKCPSTRRILDLLNSICGLSNDLLGMLKEFSKGEDDNIVVFKVLHKGISVTEAVEQVCTNISDELDDFVRMRDFLLNKFSYDDNLIKYLDILEAVIDGNNRYFSVSTRHQSAGLVKLID